MTTSTRKLAAIMFTDIVGYTALMGEDEHQAMKLLEKNREVQKPLIEKYNGQWLKELGDGTLSSFTSAIDAVNCAIEIQRVLKWDPQHNLRIGIHVGDVVFEKGDVFGAGVNVASRLEPLAEPGGICVSGRVHDDIINKPDIDAVFLGEKELKNVDHPVKVYALTGEGLAEPGTTDIPAKLEDRHLEEFLARERADTLLKADKKPLNLLPYLVGGIIIVILALILYPRFIPEKTGKPVVKGINPKSIAVLPFTTFSEEQEDLFFTDGVHDDILTQLAKIRDLMVISRTSVNQYKDTQKTMREIAAELNVANILEGSVRRAGDRIRVVAQLVKADTDEHLWAETYDRDYADIFAIQSDVAQKIASALKATLTPDKKNLIEKKPTDNMEAYDYYLRGNDYLHRGNAEEELRIAIQMYEVAVELDPTFALAFANLSQARTNLFWFGGRSREHLVEAKKAVDEAFRLKPDLAEAHIALGEYLNKGYQNYEEALEHFTKAHKSQPNNSDVYTAIAFVQKRRGQWEESVANYVKAMELDPRSASKILETGLTYLYMREYREAEKHIKRSIALAPDSRDNHTYAAWLYLLWQGDIERAGQVVREAVATVDPVRVVSGGKVYFFDRGLWRFDLLDGDYDEIIKRLSADFFGEDRISYLFSKAQVHSLMGDAASQLAYYDSARVLLERKVQDQPSAFKPQVQLGYACANLGLKDQAIQAGLKAVELMPISLCHW